MGTVNCPRCGSTFTEEAMFDEKELSVKRLPKYKCQACKALFGDLGVSPYSDIVKTVSFQIKGFFTDKVSFYACCDKKGQTFKICSDRKDCEYRGCFLDDQWQSLSHALFDECYLEWWRQNYFSSDLLNGTSWTLEIKLQRKHVLHFHGCNGFPPYWNDLLGYLEPFFSQADLSLQEFLV